MRIIIGSYRGPTHITRCLSSLRYHVKEQAIPITIIDDSPQAELTTHLPERGFRIVPTGGWGFANTMKVACRLMAEYDDDYCVFWEEDFVLKEDISFRQMARHLNHNPDLAQVALVRQPVYAAEKEAGSVLAFIKAQSETEVRGGVLVQDYVFTTNPAIWRRAAWEHGWPMGTDSEARKTRQLVRKGYRFGYLVGQQVEHIGEEKEGHGY